MVFPILKQIIVAPPISMSKGEIEVQVHVLNVTSSNGENPRNRQTADIVVSKSSTKEERCTTAAPQFGVVLWSEGSLG